jgi:hypothetical protein
MDQGQALMLLRLALQGIAGALVARGIGDVALWEAISGAALSAGGAWWSWRVRRDLTSQAAAGALALGMARETVGRR